MTDSKSGSDSTPPKPRGLWSLIGASPTPSQVPVDQDTETANSSERVEPDADEDAAPEPETPKQRGLWGMMRQSPSESPAAEDAEQPPPEKRSKSEISTASDGTEIRSPATRSLFALMRRADSMAEAPANDPKTGSSMESPDDDESTIYIRRSAELALPDEEDDDYDDDTDLDQSEEDEVQNVPAPTGSYIAPLNMQAIDQEDLEPRSRLAAEKARKQGWIGFGSGITAVAASALSLWPNFMASLPATMLGFGAIISGYVALTGSGRRDISGKTRVICLAGMLLGTAGIFLGPLLFSSLGRNLRETTGPQGTRRHLQQIGEGLDRHYTEHEGYPIGGTFGRNDAGTIRGQHGWMTFLLPFVGESDLYREIDQAKPYEDPINRNAMGRNVSVYFAAGGDKSRIGQGYSVSHYAGLGGEIDDANRLSHVGIFERDVAVKREEITDGLANTLIVGELAGTYPPWGDPENWRTIGRGLNKDLNGFGSFSANGATFLLGDGSVKFFSNKTDRKLLERMSTRDGTE